MASCILPDQFCGKMQENGFAKMEKNFLNWLNKTKITMYKMVRDGSLS
jgi:hypothetical protein